MGKIKQKSILAIFIAIFFIQNIYANDLDVNINLPSGTYDKVIKLELTPTDPSAKTFFCFDPNGTPNDAFLYTGAIILKASTPIIYFSFINTKIESKIKQNNYVFNYPDAIFFESGASIKDGLITNLKIKNTSDIEVDISYWEIKKDNKNYIIPDNTILKSQENFNINYEFSGTGFISLFSPNLEKKDFIEIIDNTPVINENSKIKPTINKNIYSGPDKKTPIPIPKEIDRGDVYLDASNSPSIAGAKKPTISTTQEIDRGTTLLGISDSTNTTGSTNNDLNPTISTQEIVQNTDSDNFIGNNLKLSSQESMTKTNSYKIIIPLILCFTLLIGIGFQIYKRSKKI